MTNGVIIPNLEHVDSVLFSLKAVTEDIHLRYTGQSNKKILKNFTTIYASEVKLSAISLVVPELIEAREIERIAMFIASIDKNISFMVHAYFAIPNAPWRTAKARDIEEAVRLARKHLSNVPYRTLDLKRIGEPAIQIY
jgi:pyruvate-formate lyase-activating enzyme